MNISLTKTNITKVAFESYSENMPLTDGSAGGKFEVRFDKVFNESIPTQFIIRFHIIINDEEEKFKLQMTSNAFFTTDMPIDDEFKNSPFPNVNAPAIAFPFLRSSVAQFTLNSGINPIMLPTINFVEFAKEPKNEKDNKI